jgi:hypothetical protein
MKNLSNLKWYFALPVWYLIMTALTFVIWFGLSQAVGGTEDVFTNPVTCLKFSSLMAIPFTAITLLTISMSNSSQKFWDRANMIDDEIDAAETKEEVNRIINSELIEGGNLRVLSGGGPHHQKMREMYSILVTKYKYLKK